MNDEEYLENILTVPSIYNIRLSQNGEKVGFSWKNVHPNIDVFYINLKEKSQPIALTETNEATMMVDFFPKSNAVLVSEDKSRNERARLFRVDLTQPKIMVPITEENPRYFLRFGDIHQSEKWLFYGANYDFDKNEEIEPTWMYCHNLETGEKFAIAKPIKPAWSFPSLNSIGTHILYTRKEHHPKGQQIWLTDIEGIEDREILNFGSKAKVWSKWLADGKTIAFYSDCKGKELQTYYSVGTFNIETNEINWIIDKPHRKIDSIHSTKVGNYLVVYEVERAKSHSSIINIETMREMFLPKTSGTLGPISPVFDNEWIGTYYSSTQPIDILKFKLDEIALEKMISLTNVGIE